MPLKDTHITPFKDTRKLYLKGIVSLLIEGTELDNEKTIAFAKSLEANILSMTHSQCNEYGELTKQNGNRSPIFIKLYESNMRTLFNNCKKDNYVNNQDLLNNITNSIVTPKEIATSITTCPQALFIDKNKKYFDEIEQQEQISYNKEININSQHKCSKCKQNKCTVNLAQLRGADEPMSLLITCLNCGNKWKQG